MPYICEAGPCIQAAILAPNGANSLEKWHFCEHNEEQLKNIDFCSPQIQNILGKQTYLAFAMKRCWDSQVLLPSNAKPPALET